ncbi:MAG: hypothetical protein GY715_03200 [Planctomycetes bacterium]|nr:hypothetical protein [Planctomycetota bacterium]
MFGTVEKRSQIAPLRQIMTQRIWLAALVGVPALTTIAGPPPPVEPQTKMGDPIQGLTPAELTRFDIGRVEYDTPLTEPEGLGPVFNKESCGNCHNNPLGGTGAQTVTRFGMAGKGTFDPLQELGGSLLQAQSISIECAETLPPHNRESLRVTNSALAFGLVEAIPDADLEANELTPPLAGISGRVHWVEALEWAEIGEPMGTLHAGRFGWKAQVATVLTFSGDAALNEMGLTNRLVGSENDPNGIDPPALLAPDFCDTVPDPEDGPEGGVPGNPHFIDRVTDFQRFLGPAPQTPKSGMSGETIFNSIGCASCHVSSFTTSGAPAETALQNKVIRPYSDFLLHSMGSNGDGIVQGDATDKELKTPPLWGVRKRDPMWHDARFDGDTFENRVTLAIEAHFVPGAESTLAGVDVAWGSLSPGDKAKVIQFLDSLGRVEFDADGDDDVELTDFTDFADCFGGGPYTPDDPCAIHDIDQDGDVDTDDYASFLLAYTGPMNDCNTNGELDITDIINGTSLDLNGNGIPDECGCSADLNGNADVGFDDILLIIAAWGCTSCPEDVSGNGIVDFADILEAIAQFGPCS